MEENSITIIEHKKEKRAEIMLGEELTIYNIAEVKEKLTLIFDDYQQLDISSTTIRKFDLAGIQLLYSLKRTATERGKIVNIKLEMAEDILEILTNTGFTLDMITTK